MNKNIKENSFEGSPGGNNGTSNYQSGYGTYSSPDVTQDPAHFQAGKSVDQHSNTTDKGAPKAADIEKDVNTVFSKKQTPSVDEVIAGLKYEMGQQNKKDKTEAKQIVLQNLKKNPRFYTEMNMLNINDKTMMDNVTENRHPNDAPARSVVKNNVDETKKIFAEMAKDHGNKYVVNSGISDVMKQMWDAKRQRNNWKNGK